MVPRAIEAAEGATDAANIMKPQLARGELRAIGATTLDEYRKHIEKDAALVQQILHASGHVGEVPAETVTRRQAPARSVQG